MRIALSAPCVPLLAAACAVSGSGRSAPDALPSVSAAAGSAVVRSSSDVTLGTLRLEPAAAGGVRLVGTLEGIPQGAHAIHIHAVGRCEPPAFETAGGHFNPHGRMHGLSNPAGPHAGDAPSLVADAAGRAAVDIVFAMASLDPASQSRLWDVDGSAIVIHANADDQVTDPAGNAGARIACGVIATP